MTKNLLPEISRISDFEGGQAVQIYCENADWQSKVYWYAEPKKENQEYNFLNENLPQTPPENALVFKPEETVKQVLYIGQKRAVPCECALMWVENENGFSKPFVANRPQIWNTSLKRAYKGANLAVYGKNLNRASYRKRPLGVLVSEKGEIIKLTLINTPSYGFDKQEYTVEYRIPENIENGKYKLYVNTSEGADFAWSDAWEIEIASLDLISYFNTKWNRTLGDNVPMPECEKRVITASDLGALEDMYETIQSAIDELKCGGIVVLGAGTFAISKTLILKNGVVLLGAGKGATTLCSVEGKPFVQDWSKAVYAQRINGNHLSTAASDWQPAMANYSHLALVQLESNAGVEGINFKLSGASIGVLIANETNTPVENSFVNNCEIDSSCLNFYEVEGEFGAYSSGIISIANTNNTVLFDNVSKALSPICYLPGYHYDDKIIHNRFECLPRQMLEPYLSSMYYSVIAQNDFVSGRRGPMFQFGLSNSWIYQNRSIDVARSENALETYMSEYGKGFASGRVQEATENSFTLITCDEETLSTANNCAHKLYAVVIDGKGFGQYRTVTGAKGTTFTVDKAWDVMPDETTAISVMSATVNNLFVDNNTTLSNSPTQFIYGVGIENVYAGHEIDFGDAIYLQASLIYPPKANERKPLVGVLAFNTVAYCQLRCTGSGIIFKTERLDSVEESIDPENIYPRTHGIFGNSIYRNVLDGSKGHNYVKNQNIWMNEKFNAGITVSGGYNLVAKNHILGYNVSINMLDDCEGNLFDRNTYTGEGVRFVGRGKPIGTDKDRRWE